MSTQIINKKYLLNIFHFFAALLPLSSAYAAEYYYDILPCMLCVMQRFFFFIALYLAILGIIFKKKYFTITTIISFFCCMIVAAYNIAIEQGWIIETTCHASNSNIILKLFNKHNIPCSIVSVKILNISLAKLNFIYCLIIITLSCFTFKKHTKA